MLLSRHISTPAKYQTCTSIRVYLSFSERNHEWLVFRHSLTHRWSRRSRRKYNPPTMRFSWCLVELELKYTSKTPNTVGYIRRMRPIDFSEQRALRRDLLFAGGHTNKKKKEQNKTKQNKTKTNTPIRQKTVDDFKRNTDLVALGIWIRFYPTTAAVFPVAIRSSLITYTSNLTLYLGKRIYFCRWRGSFSGSSVHD